VSAAQQIPQAAYCAAKGGLAHLTKELAMQWGRYRVRVNAFAPGFFATEMTQLMLQPGTPAHAARLRSVERAAILSMHCPRKSTAISPKWAALQSN